MGESVPSLAYVVSSRPGRISKETVFLTQSCPLAYTHKWKKRMRKGRKKVGKREGGRERERKK